MLRHVPTEADWKSGLDYTGDFITGADRDYARKRFIGKSIEEALSVFEKGNILEIASEFKSLPPVPFRYYIFTFRDYVMSPDTQNNPMAGSEAASSYLDLIEYMLANKSEFLRPVIDELMPSVIYVANHQTYYDAPSHIYGDFREKLSIIEILRKKVRV